LITHAQPSQLQKKHPQGRHGAEIKREGSDRDYDGDDDDDYYYYSARECGCLDHLAFREPTLSKGDTIARDRASC
jgi:hypothetical protein